MFSLSLPKTASTGHFIEVQKNLPFSYSETGASQFDQDILNFDNDWLRVPIGNGSRDFERAKMGIRSWQMFPEFWTQILPENAPIKPGTTVAMYAYFAGLWCQNACRVVYTLEDTNRFGFAYGTLPGHIESGEELFVVEQDSEGLVWYEIRAFSRPRHWLARLGYLLIRQLQARFRRDSARQMFAFVQKNDTA